MSQLNFTKTPSKIIGIQFSILSPEEIRNNSVAEIVNRETYINNKPVINGLFDPRMGVLEPGIICPTDGLDYMKTPGYFGHIELAKPLFYVQYLSTILKVIRSTCIKCGNLLIQKEQQNLTEKIDVTPEEVRLYFNGLKENGELPEFQAEIEMAQIVMYIQPTEAENKRIVDKLNELKKEIEDGASIRLKAIINSDDPGVANNGGRYPVTKESNFIKEFKEMAFTLEVNEVSEPFKSDFGYHLMQLHEIKGNTRIASHILIQPKIEDAVIKETKEKVEAIKQEIIDGKITFEEAVKKYSEDKETKNNNGLLIYGPTGETTFDLTRMDPALYARVNDLNKDEITDVFYDQTREGEKMFKFIVIKDKTDTHTAELVNDYEKIQQLALQKKRQESITKWAKDKIKETYIKLGEEHRKCTFEKNWTKENSK